MKKLMGIALVIAALAYTINLLFDAGVFYRVQDIHMQQCRKIEGVNGAEDIVPLQDGGVLISSLNRHGNASGALYYLQPGQAPLLLPGDYPAEFFPHGIDVWQQEGNTWVYVVNHRHQEDRIDVFRFERAAMRLIYQPALSRSVGKNINDISVIDKTRWLLTRDHAYSGLLGRIEDYLRLPLARVLLIDDSGVHTLLDGLHFANGIYYDRQRERLYVAETTSGAVSSWAWQPGGTAPMLLSRATGLHGVDNIMPDEKGDRLLVAAHPQLLKLAAYQKDAQVRSPSLVWQLAIASNGEAERAQVIHQSHGQMLAAISVAAPLADQVVMGSVFDNGLLMCRGN
ncbi:MULTISPECIES: arylesterase [Photorhabdus]|uniref:Arylesterase n=2 Tax=Photorhabdus TaxID=29487 RepID=A0ABX0AUW1_9GAMM|nr:MULTISPECIES: arylesterase [Photorhabdus]MCC8376102.1 arylesterase [Photorhabdus bodei]MCC8466272.1 arylesterase [Photorhabdus bodei]MCT8352780.1 arylesterase [Photorhabdus kayaii]MDB6367861.1 arylesterase [Photorhabdus bodei]MDB6371820.1 arylesterase [Photorhabdus bodei]